MVNSLAVGLGTTFGVLGGLFIAWHALTYYEVDIKCERPKFKVVKHLGQKKKSWFSKKPRYPAEIRRYAPVLAAEVTMTGTDMRPALSEGFMSIARFIFGKNTVPGSEESTTVAMTAPVTMETAAKLTQNTKIAMTAPVTAEKENSSEAYIISFIMPSEYTKETLPKPINENVKIREVPARTLAALGWSGGVPSEKKMEEKADQLRSLLKEAGVRINEEANVHLWQYHPPFAPIWMRLNEILLEVEDFDSEEEDSDKKLDVC